MQFIEQYTKISSSQYGDRFVGMNTGHGFVGCYDKVIDESKLKRLYIIKGAAGTGKSTLMKRIADRCSGAGVAVERFACSSDPHSLDCVIIDSSIAVLDGTMPHPSEMRYPGAVSEIIDVTQFWDSDRLTENRSLICDLSDKKSSAFDEAYHGIRSLELLSEERYQTIKSALDYDKMAKAIDRFIHTFGQKNNSKCSTFFLRGIGMKGKCRLDYLEAVSKTVVNVTDIYGSAYVFMQLLADAAKKMGYAHIISTDPICPTLICDIYLTDSKTLITVDVTDSPDKVINMQRFICPHRLAECRGGIRLSKKCSDIISGEVLDNLAKAGEYHFSLEQIYSSAMDFTALGEYTERKIEEVMSML